MNKINVLTLRAYAWYKVQQLDKNAFGWNQLMDLGIVIGLLFVFVQNSVTLSGLFTTIVTSIQTQLTKLITTNAL